MISTEHSLGGIKGSKTVNVCEFMHELTYESASIGLFGVKIDAKVPYAGKEGDVDFYLAQHDVIKDFVKHAAEPEFYKDENYRVKDDTLPI